MKKLILVVALMMMAGCVSRPQVSREEYFDMTTRTYEGVTQKQVFQAAENFFTLLDGDDFDITHSKNKVQGIRNFTLFLIGGNDTWEITTLPAVNGQVVSVSLLNRMSTAAHQSKRKVIFDVFWARMDYLLAKRHDWLTCEEVAEMLDKKETWGDPLSVCDEITLKNNHPQPSHIVANR